MISYREKYINGDTPGPIPSLSYSESLSFFSILNGLVATRWPHNRSRRFWSNSTPEFRLYHLKYLLWQ